ncbi:hypothetical protein Y032_0031g2399 [Ancylostoma ceylanicum]|uniref:Uncharacterized protein n=1 Tax=Ancylostoma ceylanicum TaxID=53326 RepID=A0A016UQW9_9BILA|nr:hypothetical protein Y032_0031g2399 [Ancylostoma ceylanicum]
MYNDAGTYNKILYFFIEHAALACFLHVCRRAGSPDVGNHCGSPSRTSELNLSRCHFYGNLHCHHKEQSLWRQHQALFSDNRSGKGKVLDISNCLFSPQNTHKTAGLNLLRDFTYGQQHSLELP